MKLPAFATILCLAGLAVPARAVLTEVSSVAVSAPADIGSMAVAGVSDEAALTFPSVTNARMAKSVPQGTCTPVPTATTTFSTTDAYAYVFFNISGHASGEQLTRVWYSPDGQIAGSASWSAMSSGYTYCPWAGLQIAGSAVASMPGTWRVRVFSNMITDVAYVDLTFTITSGGGGGGGGFPTITNARMAKSVPQGACTPIPTATTTFSSTDPYAYLFFNISGQASGEQLSSIWYSPDGQIAVRGGWDPLAAGGGYCLTSSLQIAGASAAGEPGTWRVQVFSNMITDVPYVDLTFTITSSGGGGGGGSTGTEMLLSQGRVAVSVTWRNQWNGTSGVGTPVKQLDQYGYFWFTGADNPEVFVKVLDFNNPAYLVFHAALSDLEYTVTFRVVRTNQRYSFKRDAYSVCGLVDTTTVLK